MREFGFWQKWLSIASLAIVLFGLALAFFNQTYFFKILFTNWINRAFWGAPDVAEQVALFQRWAYGVMGGMIAGWGVFMFYVARGPFKNKERWAWNCFAISFALWFAVDTGLSFYAGVYSNVVTNIVFLSLFAVPLFNTRKSF